MFDEPYEVPVKETKAVTVEAIPYYHDLFGTPTEDRFRGQLRT